MKDNPTSGKMENIKTGESVGNQSAGSAQPMASIVTTLPSCKVKGPLAGKD